MNNEEETCSFEQAKHVEDWSSTLKNNPGRLSWYYEPVEKRAYKAENPINKDDDIRKGSAFTKKELKERLPGPDDFSYEYQDKDSEGNVHLIATERLSGRKTNPFSGPDWISVYIEFFKWSGRSHTQGEFS